MDKLRIPGGAKLAHAYIAASMNADTRAELGRTLAAAMLCEDDAAPQKPCGHCRACRKTLLGIHPDVITVAPGLDSQGRKRREMTVDQVRAVAATAAVMPNEGRRKAYVIEDADTMNTQAQNALLKIIEEPPERVLFILTCNNRARILPTILSRAAVIPIAVCSQEECLRALGRLAPQADEQRRQQAAEFAQGNIGKALQILQDEAKLKLACDARRIGQMICIGQEFELLSSLQEYTGGKKREEFLALLQEVRAYFLELMRVQSGVTCAHEEIPLAVKNRFSTLQAMRILDIIDRTAAQVTQNVSLSLAAAAFCAGAKAAQQ